MTIQLERVVEHVRRLVAPSERRCKSDRQLLQEFQASNDQRAFAALVERHGPLVVRVCRHVLGHEHDAQDAFQATFLVLARRVASIRKPESLAAWLHGVAHRIAMQAKRNAARRRAQERQAMTVAASNCSTSKRSSDVAWHEVQAVLDEEIQSLAEKYRTPFVLCVLEGQARAEVARPVIRLAGANRRLQSGGRHTRLRALASRPGRGAKRRPRSPCSGRHTRRGRRPRRREEHQRAA
jgi:RNA polymerase sigma factor (sigma-70 family)